MNFLSLTDNKLDASEIYKCSEDINRFIIDAQHIVSNMKDNTNSVYLDKFKIIYDMIKLYNESKLADMLREHVDNNEIDICNNEYNRFTDSWNTYSSTTDEEDNEETLDEPKKEDTFDDIYLDMLDREYNNICKNSILKQYINVTRCDNVSFNDT